MRSCFGPLLLSGLVCVVVPLTAGPVVIGFDALLDSTPVTTQFSGLVFTNATAITAGISLNEFEFPPRSGANVVFDDNGPISIAFLSPISSFGAYFTYSVGLTLRAFDALDNPIALATSTFSNNEAL